MSRRIAATVANDNPTLPSRLLQWGLGIGGAVLSMIFILALLSYHPDDASLNTAADGVTHNWLGSAGAWVADLSWQTWGAAGLFIPLAFLNWSCRFTRNGRLNWWQLKAAALLFCVIAAALCFASLPVALWSHGGTGIMPGGVIGAFLLNGLHVDAGAARAVTGLVSFLLTVTFAMAVFAVPPWQLRRLIARSAMYLGRAVMSLLQNRRDFHTRHAYSNDDEDEFVDNPKVVKLKPAKRAPVTIEAPMPKPKAKPKRKAPELKFEDGDFNLPPLELLTEAPEAQTNINREALAQNAEMLMGVLEEFGINGEITEVHPGPVVTLYELQPAAGIKSARVIGLADDIARSMSATAARVAVVPGRNVIGIELPNQNRETVYLRELFEAVEYQEHTTRLPLALGKDIGGTPILADLAKMPHLLVAGTTGSGKSVAVNSMILSLLYALPPEKCRLIMIDPKMLELSVYDDIPHLLTPVVTEPKKAVVALKWTVREMEDRYRAMSKLGVRNVDGYNQRLAEARQAGEVLSRKVQTGFDPDTGKPIFEEQPLDLTELPYIVVVVDEFADLMLVAGKEIEGAIQRLAQMARAAGIHLIMATQRPSVDVITGTIKANFPTRISFQVTSKIDSRTILGESGAEQLLGMGDMLYMAAGGRVSRVHGPYVSDREVENIVEYLRQQGTPEYIESVTVDVDEDGGEDGEGADDGPGLDPLFDKAVDLVSRERKASTSFIQRHFQIGYNRAARIIEAMERQGMISEATATGKREIHLRETG